MIIFETDEFIIRRFEPGDASRLYEYHLDEEVKKWIPNESYEDINEAAGAIEFFADMVDKNCLPYVLAVVSKGTGELIGDVGVNEVEGKPGEVEIGFVIAPEYRGRGYATKLVDSMTRYTSDRFGSKVLYGRVMKGNDASVRVLEKNGFGFVTEETGAEDDPYGNGMLVYKKES
jgi:ribosomal-protein-alanine N-acetyltransferase